MLLSTVEYEREQPTRQSVTVVVAEAQDSVDDEVLSELVGSAELEGSSSPSPPSSSSLSLLSGSGQSPEI